MNSPGRALSQRLLEAEIDERRRALRALLHRPLIRAAAGEVHGLIRRNAEWLRQWLNHNTGWHLHVDSDLARLHKAPADAVDDTRAAVDGRTGEAFDRRRAMLVCLCLAALQEFERQTILGKIAERVCELAGADEAIVSADMVPDLQRRDDRRHLIQAVRLLIDFGVLIRIDGDENQFLKKRGDVLYTIDRAVLTAMLSVRRGPSTIAANGLEQRIFEMAAEPLVEGDEARNRRLRWSLIRRLLDDPVVYYADLSDDERQYLASQRPRIVSEIEMATGLVPEIRAEGIAFVDPTGTLTDLDMPEEGTDGHAGLLVAQWLAERIRLHRDASCCQVTMAELSAYIGDLIHIHRRQNRHWRRDVEAPGYEKIMAEQIVRRFEALRLVHRDGSRIVPNAAIARYAAQEPQASGPGPDRLWA